MSLKSEMAWKKWSGVAAQCPICGSVLLSGAGGLTCGQGHHFDLSRQGSVQLMPGSSKASPYDASLFAARRRMLALGLFTPALGGALPLMEKAVPPGRLWWTPDAARDGPRLSFTTGCRGERLWDWILPRRAYAWRRLPGEARSFGR